MPYPPSDYRPENVPLVRPAVSAATEHTPLRRSAALSEATGAEVYLKCECLQRTGSFKIRGAVAALSRLSDDAGGVVTCSTGNHGTALTVAAAECGIPCTVVVPGNVAPVKEAKIRAGGARVVHAPHPGYDRTQEWTLETLDELGGVWISPFEDPWVMAGNGGTTGLEILEDLPEVDTIVTPVGGGGLAAGLGQALELTGRLGEVRLLGVNSEASPGMARSRREGRALTVIESDPTLADGIEGGVGEITFTLGNRYLDEVVEVTETALAEAVGFVHRAEGLVIEGAAATGVAALLTGRVAGRTPGERVVVILTGSNIDPARHRSLIR